MSNVFWHFTNFSFFDFFFSFSFFILWFSLQWKNGSITVPFASLSSYFPCTDFDFGYNLQISVGLHFQCLCPFSSDRGLHGKNTYRYIKNNIPCMFLRTSKNLFIVLLLGFLLLFTVTHQSINLWAVTSVKSPPAFNAQYFIVPNVTFNRKLDFCVFSLQNFQYLQELCPLFIHYGIPGSRIGPLQLCLSHLETGQKCHS